MRDLVKQGRSRGVIVYADDDPIGWCQFVQAANLRFPEVVESGADWFITCFVVDPKHRGHGATHGGLRAALASIRRLGGGVVEGHATAIALGPPPVPESKELHTSGDVLFWGGRARVQYGVEVAGVGPVAALFRSSRSMHNAALGGTVHLYQRAGFEAVGILHGKRSDLADRVIMQRTV